ncbi:MAG TPA: redox-regulated ATPase YchF, partial [Clostridiales bacterium]|nr:redox-regulated ATPase YchF [Clostridiales bacterium]
MKLGIVGLPNVGKSTIFNALTAAGVDSANYPFCTIEPNVGVVAVPDERLDVLAKIYNPKKVTPAIMEFVDIAGLVKGAGKGEGLGNKFLSHIRETDAIAHVVRCFDDPNVVHVDGSVDPKRDVETINLELIFSDLEILDRKIDKCGKMMKSGEKKYKIEMAFYTRLKEWLERGKPARSFQYEEQDLEYTKDLFLLTSKPVIYVANISEDEIVEDTDNHYVRSLREIAEQEGAEIITFCASIEQELSGLTGEEKTEFLNELGIHESGLSKLIKAGYKLLGLISFLTAGEPEVRAWTIQNGTKAPQAAGKIHSDFERGFIRAEIVPYDVFVECGSWAHAREKGMMRSEGKEYV